MCQPDEQLIERYLTGEIEAFERLYARYAPRLLGFLIGLDGDRDAAEEAAQLTWIKVSARIGGCRDRARFRAWLFRTAHRTWLDERRRAARRRHQPLDLAADAGGDGRWADPAPDPRRQATQAERRARLRAAIAKLPESIRAAVLLRIDGELTHREIARELGCPLGTALWRVREGTRRLTEMLGDDE